MADTENKFVIWYAGLIYTIESRISDYMMKHGLTKGKWYHIHGHFYNAEAWYNMRLDHDLKLLVRRDKWTTRVGSMLIRKSYNKRNALERLALRYAYSQSYYPWPYGKRND